MIYLFYGHNHTKNQEKAQSLVTSLLAKKPDASYFKLNQEQFNSATLEELLESVALFQAKYIVQGNRLFENKDYSEYLEEHIQRIKKSPHVFIFTEEKLSAPLLKKLKTHAEKVVEQKKETPKREFDQGLFALTDSFGARDRKRTWKILHESYLKGATPEEVFNILVWQLKTLLISRRVSQGEALSLGVKPFPYKKAKGFSQNYTEDELKNLLEKFTKLFHESRLGKRDLDLGLEYLVLSI